MSVNRQTHNRMNILINLKIYKQLCQDTLFSPYKIVA